MAEPTASVTLLIASWLTPSSLFIFVNLVIGTIAITSRFTSSPNNQIQQHELQQHPLTRSPSLLQRVRSFRLTHQYTYEPTVLAEPVECTHPQLVRTPSFLERVRSFGLAHYYNYEPTPTSTAEPGEFTQPQLVRTSSLLERVRSFNFSLHRHETTETSHAEKTDQAQAQAQTNQPESEEPEKPKEVPQLSRTPSLLQRLQSMNFSRIYKGEEEQEPEPTDASGSGSDPSRKDAEMRKSASERGRSARVEDEESVERRRPATTRESTGEDEEVDAKADDFINRFKKQLRLQRVDSILRYREMLRGN